MTDTLVEPPPPPTVRDEALSQKAARPSKKRLVIAVALLAPFILLGAVAAFLYVFVFRYEPVARRHIPGNANVVARVEASDIALFGPVRKHLWPLLFEQSFSEPTASSKKPAPSRAERIKEATGVNIATDIREAVVASVDATSWVVLLGGRIAKGHFVDGIEKMMREDGSAGWHREGPVLLGPPGSRLALGQADDGTICLGTDKDVVTAALPATDEWKHMGLPEEGAVTFVVTSQAWSGVLGAAGSLASMTGSLRAVERVTGQISLGSSPTLLVRIHPQSGNDPAALAGDVERALAAMRVLLLLAPDVAGEKEALAATKVAPAGADVLVTTPWPYDGLDRGCEKIAALLRSSSALPAASGSGSASPSR